MLLTSQFGKTRHREISQAVQDGTVISSRGDMRLKVPHRLAHPPPITLQAQLTFTQRGFPVSRLLALTHVVGPLAILLSLMCCNLPRQSLTHLANEMLRFGFQDEYLSYFSTSTYPISHQYFPPDPLVSIVKFTSFFYHSCHL